VPPPCDFSLPSLTVHLLFFFPAGFPYPLNFHSPFRKRKHRLCPIMPTFLRILHFLFPPRFLFPLNLVFPFEFLFRCKWESCFLCDSPEKTAHHAQTIFSHLNPPYSLFFHPSFFLRVLDNFVFWLRAPTFFFCFFSPVCFSWFPLPSFFFQAVP